MCGNCLVSSIMGLMSVIAVIGISAHERKTMLRMLGTGTPDAHKAPKARKTAQSKAIEDWRNRGK